MKIGMLTDLYKPHISGITNYISLNKKYLEKRGHEVYVFTFGDEDYKDDERRIVRSTGMPILDTGYYISMRFSSKARRLLRTMDVVHIHHPFISGSLATTFCQPRGIPVIFTNHTRYDLYAQAYLPGVPDQIGEAALQVYMPRFCRSCDLVISPSLGMRDVLQHFGVDVPIEIVPNGVDLTPFGKTVEPIQRAELGFKAEDVVLVYVGRLGPEKNLPFLLRSFAGTLHAYEYARLLIIGGGPEQDNLQDRVRHMGIEKQVHFTGMVPYEQLPQYLAAADAFVTASVTEVHPLSVIEAMAAGLPVLGIQSPGVGDTVNDGETGLIAEEEDLACFTAKMTRIISDHTLRRKMGKHARQASEIYAIERTVLQMEKIYKKVAARGTVRKRGLRARIIRWWDVFSR